MYGERKCTVKGMDHSRVLAFPFSKPTPDAACSEGLVSYVLTQTLELRTESETSCRTGTCRIRIPYPFPGKKIIRKLARIVRLEVVTHRGKEGYRGQKSEPPDVVSAARFGSCVKDGFQAFAAVAN